MEAVQVWQGYRDQADREIREMINNIVIKTEYGHCAECGKMTTRWDIKWEWFICEKHDSEKVAADIADHVSNPNG